MAAGQYQRAERSLDASGRPTGGTPAHVRHDISKPDLKIENISVPGVSSTSPRRDSSKSGLAFFTFFGVQGLGHEPVAHGPPTR